MTDPTESPALPLLLDLERRDITVRVDGDDLVITPKAWLAETDMASLRALKDELFLLVLVYDDGVQERLSAFKTQTGTTFIFEPGYRYVAGVCFSCGARLRKSTRFGRCWRCSLAWRLASNLPTTKGDLWDLQEDRPSTSTDTSSRTDTVAQDYRRTSVPAHHQEPRGQR